MRARKMTLVPLVAATYFIVAGGPFGLEDIVAKAGYAGAISILLLTPVLWSLPTALMVSELASALPEEGGYYVWVWGRRPAAGAPRSPSRWWRRARRGTFLARAKWASVRWRWGARCSAPSRF
jgi:hypothetical protein